MNPDMRLPAEPAPRQSTILVIDDDPNNLAIVSDHLGGMNFNIIVAEDGEIGVTRADYARPDLILLDIMMPGMDGFETCRRLKGLEGVKEIPVIFMTALAETEQKVKGLEAGAVDYITKPFQQEELLARVGVHLRIRELTGMLRGAKEFLERRVEERTAELARANRELQTEIAERKQAEEQLRQSQKMEAVGTLAGGVAHDFNNILTAIMGYGTILRMKMEEGTLLSGYLDDILAAAERAATLTHGLLAFSRKQELTPRPVNLNEIVGRMRNLLQRVIGEDIEFRTMLAGEQLTVMADSGQLEQVLMNLAANSRDAMPDGGMLTIRTERVDVRDELAGSSLKPGRYAVISVSDTGTGFDEAMKQRIFEPFFTTKEVGKGTGLGLSMVYGIIKQHNGEIDVYSEPGKGTAFRIYLELVEPKAEKVEAALPAPTAGGKETILVTEDDADVRRFMRHTLEEFGYTVIEAADGEEAIGRFSAHRDGFQLLILDVVMPKINGKEVFEEIRKMKADTRVLFSSGYPADIIQGKGILEAGAPFVQKPVTLHILLAKVREALS